MILARDTSSGEALCAWPRRTMKRRPVCSTQEYDETDESTRRPARWFRVMFANSPCRVCACEPSGRLTMGNLRSSRGSAAAPTGQDASCYGISSGPRKSISRLCASRRPSHVHGGICLACASEARNSTTMNPTLACKSRISSRRLRASHGSYSARFICQRHAYVASMKKQRGASPRR